VDETEDIVKDVYQIDGDKYSGGLMFEKNTNDESTAMFSYPLN
jgi:hypothetical protein